MVLKTFLIALGALLAQSLIVSGHASIWHPSMWGFNVTSTTFAYDNRPVVPLKNMTFQEWWFHNHLAYPPNEGDIFPLPAGEPATIEIACNKGATSFFASSEGGDIREPSNPNNVCPGSQPIEYHTLGLNDVQGCSLAIAYKSDVNEVQPSDFTVFSVNKTCVWTRFTDFSVPKRMPACPPGGCICGFFWVHAPNAGGEENYMNGFRCNVTNPTSTVALAQSKVPRRCGADPSNNRLEAVLGNCTYGAKQPFYWFNLEQNNMFEGPFSPPVYHELYNFIEGPQDDIFEDSYISLPEPAPNAPLPVLREITNQGQGPSSTPAGSAIATATPTRSSAGNQTQTIASSATSTPFASIQYCKRSTPSRGSKSSFSNDDTVQGKGRNHWSVMKMARRSRRLVKRETLWNMF